MRSGEEAAFREFVAARSTSLLRFAYLLTGDGSDAEDLLQSALMRLATHWPVRAADPTAYVKRTLTNLAYDRWRQKARYRLLQQRSAEPASADFTASHAEADVLVRALAQLPQRQRLMVVLRYVEGMSEQEAADAAGCSVGTVKSHSSRGLARLRELVGTELRT